MTKQEVLKVLQDFQNWRRDNTGELEQPSAKDVGKALDVAIVAIKVLSKITAKPIYSAMQNNILASIQLGALKPLDVAEKTGIDLTRVLSELTKLEASRIIAFTRAGNLTIISTEPS